MSESGLLDADTDTRDALELPASENADLCAGCSRCCEYVVVEIESPRTAREYDQWMWVLHHRGLEIYVEKPGRWMLSIETRCEKLDGHGRCGIYGNRPVLCREYDPRACERRGPLTDVVAWFHDAVELEDWLRKTRPSQWKRLEAWRTKQAAVPASRNGVAGGAALAQALVRIDEAPDAGREPAMRTRWRQRAGNRR